MRSFKCVFGRDSVMVRSWSGIKSSRIAGVWIFFIWIGFGHDEEPVCLFLDQRKNKAMFLDLFDPFRNSHPGLRGEILSFHNSCAPWEWKRDLVSFLHSLPRWELIVDEDNKNLRHNRSVIFTKGHTIYWKCKPPSRRSSQIPSKWQRTVNTGN